MDAKFSRETNLEFRHAQTRPELFSTSTDEAEGLNKSVHHASRSFAEGRGGVKRAVGRVSAGLCEVHCGGGAGRI